VTVNDANALVAINRLVGEVITEGGNKTVSNAWVLVAVP